MEGDEVAENDCTYEYADSLALYSKMPYLDQRLYEQRVARIENPTEENRSQYGHALFDQAIIIKERADSLLEMDQWLSSVELYESALQTFKAGNDYAEAYPWQAEAFGFAYFNYSMALYQAEQGKDQKGIKNIRLALSEARRILNGMEEKSIFVEQALEMIEQNLEVLK